MINMINLIIYFWMSVVGFVISIVYYIFKFITQKREIKRVYSLKIINVLIFLWLILLSIIFFVNIDKYVNQVGVSPMILLTFASQVLIGFSYIIVLVIKKERAEGELNLEHPSYFRSRRGGKRGRILIGNIIYKRRKINSFFLSLKDLEKHMCVIGATGTGKTNFLQYFLKNLFKNHKIPFLLSEFKGDYVYLQEIIPDLVVLRPGENFSINIFDPENSNPEIHVERVISILKDGQLFEGVEYSPQMEKVLYDILLEVCTHPEFRKWDNFNELCTWYLAENKNIIKYLDQTIFAIRNRLRRYSVGSLKNIFVTKNELKIDSLFEMNVLLDLSSIVRLGGRKEDAIFFLNMILKYLWDRNIEKGSRNYEGIEHITIVEDSQYFTPQSLSERTKITSYIEDIAMLLRGTGECLITLATRPAISRDVLANAGVIVVFKNSLSRKFMRELVNLDKNKEDIISMLKVGYCLVKVNSVNRPFLLYTPLLERKWLSEDRVFENNEKVMKKMRSNSNLVEKTFCEICGEEIEESSTYCKSCFTDADMYRRYLIIEKDLDEL